MEKQLERNGGYPSEIILYENITEQILGISKSPEDQGDFMQSVNKLIEKILPTYFPDGQKKMNTKGAPRSQLECIGKGSTCVAMKSRHGGPVIKLFYPLFMTFHGGGHLVSEDPNRRDNVRQMLKQFLKSFAIAKEIFKIYDENRRTTLTCELWDSSVGLCLLYPPFGGETIDESKYSLETVSNDSNFGNILNRLGKCLGLFLKIAYDVNQYHEHNYLVGDIKPSNLWGIHLDENCVEAVRNIDYGSCFDILELIKTIKSEKEKLLQEGYDIDREVGDYLKWKNDQSTVQSLKECIELKCKTMLSTRCFYVKKDLKKILYFYFGNFTDEKKISALKSLDLRALLILLVRFLCGDNGLHYYKDDPLDREIITSVYWIPEDVLSFLKKEKASFAIYNLYYNLYILLEESSRGLKVVNVYIKDKKSEPVLEPVEFLDCKRFTEIINKAIWIIQALRSGTLTKEPNDNKESLFVKLETHNLKDFDYLLEDGWKISDIIDYSKKIHERKPLEDRQGSPIRSPVEIIESLLFETES